MATTTAKRPSSIESIELPQVDIRHMTVTLIGDSPLIVHAWSDKAKRAMLEKQTKAAKTAKAAKDPWRDFVDSMYWLSDKPAHPKQEDVNEARFGMPVIAFKAAAVNACSHVDGVTKVGARGAFHIEGEFVQIDGPPPYMREDMVRIHMGTADIRYRGEFREWRVHLPIRYNANLFSAAQIINLFNTAGFGIGVGEWRPQKNGSFGMFHVATEGEV